MKLQRKALIRNLVIGIVAVDAVGIYMLKDRLSDPAQNSASALEQEALALAASPAPRSPNLPALPGTTPVEAPKTAAAPEALASRDLPKPAFGAAPAAPAAAASVAVAQKPAAAPRAAAAPVVTKTAALAAPVAAKAPVASPVPAKPAVKAVAKPAAVAKRTITVPRIAAAPSAKAPVTLSAKPSHSAKFAKMTERKRATFSKAFGVSHVVPAAVVSSASGSLYHAAPAVTAEFSPDSTQTAPEAVEVTTLAIATHPDTVTSPAPSSAQTPSAPAASPAAELPASGE